MDQVLLHKYFLALKKLLSEALSLSSGTGGKFTAIWRPLFFFFGQTEKSN